MPAKSIYRFERSEHIILNYAGFTEGVAKELKWNRN